MTSAVRNDEWNYFFKLPLPGYNGANMNSTFEERKQRSYIMMRMTYDLVMAVLFLGVAALLFLGDKLKLEQVMDTEPLLRYGFAWMCLLYGGYRLYRGIKRKG